MSQISIGGVVKGGLVAGVIMNISEFILNVPVLGARMEGELKAINLAPPGTNALILFTVTTLILGVLTVWLYAAMRPRLGPGPGSAAQTGVLVWVLSYGYASVFFGGLGINGMTTLAIGLVWTLAECVVAAVAGAYFYKE